MLREATTTIIAKLRVMIPPVIVEYDEWWFPKYSLVLYLPREITRRYLPINGNIFFLRIINLIIINLPYLSFI